MATYKMVQEKLEAQKKIAKEAQDAAICTQNRELLEAEGFSDEDNAPHCKKKKMMVAVEFSEDEDDIANGLQSIRAAALGQKEQEVDEEDQNIEGEDRAHRSAKKKKETILQTWKGWMLMKTLMKIQHLEKANSQMKFIGVEASGDEVSMMSKASQSKTKSVGCPKTPTMPSSAASNSKVVEKDFTPRTLRLALASKSHTMYGRTGLISSIISKARDKVRAFYCLGGEPEAIKKDVEWLIKDSHFVYGSINLKERTVDPMKPFGVQLIVEIIEGQWFPSTSGSKLDLETTN
ncbi:hypothetical protein CPB84DRAFT_1848505 [Gymnopilus junonius]|uniref:DUF6532 domain-containing protein n=1 Tax=Gymnopilus junonius TaxID=109634 RepID=A0A9P5NK21_GYMJU|nr:hypothetical protein CPB84DRAFT_1848505 [Gymnopilus junonius]